MTYSRDIMQAAREIFRQLLLEEYGWSEGVIDKVYAPLTGRSDAHFAIISAAKAIAAERARHQWQPIETAPKDSVGVIAWIGSPAYGYAVTAWQEKEGEWRTPIGKDGYMKIPWPILWMPLPQPPQEASK